jgi:hypothetical protein
MNEDAGSIRFCFSLAWAAEYNDVFLVLLTVNIKKCNWSIQTSITSRKELKNKGLFTLYYTEQVSKDGNSALRWVCIWTYNGFHRRVTRQQLCKHEYRKQYKGDYFVCSPRRSKARRYRKSFAKQGSGKHASTTMGDGVSVGSVQRSYLKDEWRYESVLSSRGKIATEGSS